MCQLAPSAMANVLFIDPICFKLHTPFLTKQFVYTRSDPGSIGYMVRGDIMINWTIQRGFPWARIALFKEDVTVPCAIFLSEMDSLVPSQQVQDYFAKKGGTVAKSHQSVDRRYFEENKMSVTVLPGVIHGDWIYKKDMLEKFTLAADVLPKEIC
mmetsp:Transcript_20891/g.25865  ORF Transcript_20891/g.25865 Transcript_20891/m.25865 type:complete len:155 (+) Transcript_20891:1501-1965(+)